MGVQLISVKCPECGAQLNIEEGREQAFCTYCGAKILLHNENEYIYRHIDEAGIKQAETDRIIRMKQMEYAERQRLSKEKKTAVKIVVSLALAVVGILMMVIGSTGGSDTGMLSLVGFFPLLGAAYIWLFSKKDEEEEVVYGDWARVPSSISDYESKHYTAIESMFLGAGFTNVRCLPLNDLTIGLLKKPGMVESITINGREVCSGGKKFSKDAAVVISYHSLNR